ncbi:hypothetical protein CDV36_001204 [Fusarium kuroshium]|uniref:Uncharacterized protein n=1 Tax=Fusarium kuroshium TaxID=2010991 RepID=A0A3M2SNL0_9HYPO|nr:hypothetical protein CDV36_001204 [Fusarium kuroshium]
MGKITGESDSQRQFNGIFLEDLRKHTSHRMRWLPSDRVKMLQWLAKGRHSIDTIRDDQQSLSRLATSIGIARDNLHKKHRAVLKTKLLSSLTYTLTTLLAKGEVTEYWDPATNKRRLRWPDDLVSEYTGNGTAALAATVEQVDDAEATRARQATTTDRTAADEAPKNLANVVIEIFDDDDDFVDSEGDVQMTLAEPSVAQPDGENNGRNTNNQIGWDQNQVNEAIRQSLQDQQRSQGPWGVNHQQQANHHQQQSQLPLGWTPISNQGLQFPSPPGAPPGFHAPLSQLPTSDPMNVEPQIPPELQRIIDENQLEATRLDQYRAWLEGERTNIAVRDQEIIRQSQSIAQERLKLEQDKRQEDARVQTVETNNDFEAKTQQDRANILRQQREEHDRAMADMRCRRERLEAEESALEARSRGYQAKLEEVALIERRLEAENDRLQQKHLETDQRRGVLQEQREQQTKIEQQQAELERQRAELKQRQQRQQQKEEQTRQYQSPPATVQTTAFPPFAEIPPLRPLSLLDSKQQRDGSLRGSVFQPQQPEPDSLEDARKRLEALLARPPPDDTQGPGAVLAAKMAEMPLSRPAPSQNTFSVPDTLSVSDAESVRSVAEDDHDQGDQGWATPKLSSASRFKTPPLWPWQLSDHDVGTHGLADWHTRPGFDHGNFDSIQDQRVYSDTDELDTVSVVGPSWSLLDALEKAHLGKSDFEASAYRQPKDLDLGPSTTILEALQKSRQHEAEDNSQSPVPSFA